MRSASGRAWPDKRRRGADEPTGVAVHEQDKGIRVECYAGYQGEETPRRFFPGERAIDVVDVLDRWLAPDHRYFKLKGSDGATYILRHETASGRWQLVMFESRDRLR